MTDRELEQVRELGRQALIAERERCAKAIEAMQTPEGGADYGLSSDDRRRQIRSHNSSMRAAAACVRGLPDAEQ